MRELDLDRLRTLVTISDLGSFAAAARALHLSPPAVSLHITELEQRVGATLLLRSRSGVTATGIGRSLIERGRRLLDDARDALEDIRLQVAGRSGRVRLGASTGVIAHWLPQALATLARDAPGIDIQLAVLTTDESMSALRQGRLDIGIVAQVRPPQAGLSITPWRREPIQAWVPRAWSAPRQVTPAWLASRPLILNDRGTQLQRQIGEWFAAAGVHARPRIELNYNDAIRSLVAAGYGATLLPREGAVTGDDARIDRRPLRPALWRQLSLARRAGLPEPATQAVIDALAGLGNGPRNGPG